MHEAAHAYTAYRLGYGIKSFYLGAMGAHLHIEDIHFSTDKIIIALSGPLFSLTIFTLCSMLKTILHQGYYLKFFSGINLGLGLINLIPISPLDGASILKAVFSKYLGIISGGRVFRGVSVFFCVVFALFNIIILILGVFNPGMLIIFCFVICGMRREFELSLIEKKRVLTGEVKSRKKYRYLACDCRAEYLYLAGLISYDYTICAAIFKDGRFIGELNQADIIEGSQKYGALSEIGLKKP